MLQQSKQQRLQYEKQLEEQQLFSRKVMLKYYETQLEQKTKFHKCISITNNSSRLTSQSIKIPKVEVSYKNLSEIKMSLFQDQLSIHKHTNYYELEKLVSLKQIQIVKQITQQFFQFASTIRFVQKRIQNVQKRVLSSLIRNYNKQIQKQQYNRVAQSFQVHRNKVLVKNILQIWSQDIKNKQQIINTIILRHNFKYWKQLPPICYELRWYFRIWREYVQNKKVKRFHSYMKMKGLFEFWRIKTSKSKARIRKEIIAKSHYHNTLKLCVFGLLQHNIKMNRQEQLKVSNEFLTFDSPIQTIKLPQ